MPQNKRTIVVGLEPRQSQFCLVLRMDGGDIESEPFSQQLIEDWRGSQRDLRETLYKAFWNTGPSGSFPDPAAFRNTGPGGSFPEPAAFDRSITKIGGTSRLLRDALFGDRQTVVLNRLQELIRPHLGGLLRYGRPAGIIEYKSSLDQFIPLDYLMVPMLEARPHPKTHNDWMRSLCQVLGFSFIIQRHVRGDFRETGVIDFEKRLPVDVYSGEQLTHARPEVEFFTKDNTRHFVADPQRPAEYCPYPAEQLVGRLVARPHVKFNHFACHCDTDGLDPVEHSLNFGDAKQCISLQDLAGSLETPECGDLGPSDAITFLNACSGSLVPSASRVSFPHFFLGDLKQQGFIGPEHRIPDRFASAFARVFWAYFLRCGRLGEALFRARWYFAKKYGSPLGLFYTLYADPDLHLSREADSVNL